ncbi:DNA-binding response regulator [Chryseobacterium taklimakanense]|uniref:Probable transcriptional regulatory protein NarL n=1 Tax=Chryseobacterium taklimakanense TaxID=536441 RepID=A0A239WSH0_9FLAO|nr:response regulator transcription factor [Chryseobacterium taklimakanense]AZI23068.1 DNA-binding response regulator [Chryseobacterium taklimakanense]MCG7280885.1 response regulator transcription factor [Chryseobacterium taklimakanense]SNV37382.1 Probable transcriptional regulatory protein NarL [Chryseobacterium taklimakanense]
MSHNISIVIVDDHPIVIQGLKMMLENEKFFSIVATFNDGAGIRNFIKTNEADIVLLDITLPDSNGIELCAEIKKISPKTSVIMLSNRSERSIIMQCIQNGASGYLLKNATIEELHGCIRGALSGNIVFCNEVKEIISKPCQRELSGIPRLTKREKEILKLLTEGKTSIAIAEELFLSPLTVDTHRKNIIHKFQVKNVAELISVAKQNNIV